jgi:hypothetical protein
MDPTLEKAAQDQLAGYDQEVLCASWNPLVTVLSEPVSACRDLVAELAGPEVESFLVSFYRSQQG